MARKLNKAVVAAVASVAVLGGGAYFAAPKIIAMVRPVSKLIAEGDAAAARGDWKLAATDYGKAANRSGNDIDLQIKYVDAMEYNVDGDIEKLRAVRATQAQILANDPRSVPALRRVLVYQRADVRNYPADTAAVRSLAGTADRLLQTVPDDREARLAKIACVFEPYIRGLDVRDEDVAAAQAAADKIFDEKPEDGESFRMAMTFRRYAMQQTLRRGDNEEGKKAALQNIAFADAGIAKAPTNASVWIARADAYRDAAFIIAGRDDAKREAYGKTYYESLEKGDQFVKSDDPQLVSIRGAFLQQLERRDPKQAEARYRAFVKELPDDRQPRIMLAEFLARQPARRDEAIAVLASEFKPTRPLRGMESIEQKLYANVESVRRTSIRLGALAAITDEADRKSRIATIETETAALNSDPDISQRFKPALLRIQGGIELAKGNITEAINTLDSAMKLMNPDGQTSVEQEMFNDTLMEYAQAQLRLNQTGQARPALAKLVERKPENLIARAMLADILIRERNYDAAKPQVELLQRFASGSSEVARMALRLDAMKGDDLKNKYKGMAETDRDKQFLKLQAAATLNDVGEVRRLAGDILAKNPADFDAVGAFVQASLATDKRDEAMSAVAAAIKANPGEARFKALADSLAAVSPEQRQQLISGRVDNIADPFLRALSKGELARTQGKPVDALAFFKEAQKLKPDDARGYEAQFQLGVLSQRFDDAEAVLPALARLNSDQAGGDLRRVQLAGARATVEPDVAKRQQKLKDVVAQAQTLVQQNHELAAASLLYAQLLQQTGDYTTAIDQFGQTLDKSPTNVDALVGMTDSLMRANRQAEARDRITTLKSIAPDDARVRELDMNYELRFGDPLKAIDALAAQVEKSPTDPAAAGRLGLALEQVAAAKKPEEAKPFLARAGEVYAKAFERFPQDLRFLSAYAEIQRRLDQPDVAEKAVEKAAADPTFKGQTNVVMLLADQYARSGKTEAATRVLTDLANSTKPAPVEAVQRLAIIFAQQKRLQDAMAVLDLRPEDANVQRQRVTLLMDSGDLANARSAVEATLATHPDPETYLLAAVVALRSGDLNQCEGFANKVLAVRPSDVGALFYRGQVKLNRTPPDLDGARDDLVKARDLSNNSVDVKLALAEAYRRRGERDAAQVELQQAWSANRENKQVLMRLVDSYTRTVPPSWTAVTNVLSEAKASPKLAADPDVLLIEAEAYAARNDAPRAVASAQAALKADPKSVPLQQRYFDVLLRAKAYRDVIAESAALLTDAPDSWWVYRVRGIAFRGMDQKAEAVKAFDGAFNLASTSGDPNTVANVARTIAQQIDRKSAIAKLEPYADPTLKVLVGEMLHDSGDISASLAKLEPLAAEGEKLPAPILRRARQTLGLCYLESSPVQAVKAKAIFEQLLKETPDDITLLNNLACVLLLPESGPAGPADAMKPAQRAYDLIGAADSSQLGPIIQDTYGYVLFRNNRVNDGIDQLRRSAETARFPDVFVHLAEAYLTTNNLDGAQTAIEDAKARIDEIERAKQRIDPALKDKLTTLTSDLANKKAIAPGGG